MKNRFGMFRFISRAVRIRPLEDQERNFLAGRLVPDFAYVVTGGV